MANNVNQLSNWPRARSCFGPTLCKETASQLSPGKSSSISCLIEINRYLAVFRERPLPRSRQEFETRATLLQLLRDLETFISIKVEFYQNYQEELQA
ncbi:MAG: hypothetical protein ACLRPC_04470 [Streptococcus sp.]